MSERLLSPYKKTHREVEAILSKLPTPIISPITGDAIWTTNFNEKNPFEETEDDYLLAISPLGKNIIKDLSSFLASMEAGNFEPVINGLDQITGLRGVVKKIKIGNMFFGHDVFVKTLKPIAEPYIDTTGIEQFTAMRLLEENGIAVASPLLATNYRIVTMAIDGKQIENENSPDFISYLEKIRKVSETLVDQQLWNKEWLIENNPSNYFETNNGIVAIDPIYKHPVLFLG